MAANAARKPNPTPLQDSTPSRVYFEYDLPEELAGEARTADFGQVATIVLKQLTPLEEKAGVGRARGDALRMAYELAEISIASVIDTDGVERAVHGHDGTLTLLIAQLNPKIRSLVMQAYADIASPSDKATALFMKSRRTRA